MGKSKKRRASKINSSKKIENLLIENFVGLQKAMTNLSIKFSLLADNISKLLEVLELSAKSYLEKEKIGDGSDLEKRINILIEQNKAIAEGLLLIDDTLRNRDLSNRDKQSQVNQTQQKISPKLLPKES